MLSHETQANRLLYILRINVIRKFVNRFKLFRDLYKKSITAAIKSTPENRERSFDKLTEFMCNRTVNKIATALLRRINRINPNISINVRQFLSIYAFAAFPEFTLNGNTDLKLYYLCNLVVDKLHNPTAPNLMAVAEYLELYTYYYDNFMQLDRRERILDLCHYWHTNAETTRALEKNTRISAADKIPMYTQLEYQQQHAINLGRELLGVDLTSEVEKYSATMFSIEETYTAAYWDMIAADIAENKFDLVLENVRKLIDHLMSTIAAETAQERYKREIAENVDFEFINAQIEAGAFDDGDFMRIATYLCDLIIELQAADRNTATKNAFDAILAGDFTREHIYVEILKLLIRETDAIGEDIRAIALGEALSQMRTQ